MKTENKKGAIEDKISSKLHELVSEFKVEKGHSLIKAINEAAKKIAKAVSRKIKNVEKDKVTQSKAGTAKAVVAKLKKKKTPKKILPAESLPGKANSRATLKTSPKVEGKTPTGQSTTPKSKLNGTALVIKGKRKSSVKKPAPK